LTQEVLPAYLKRIYDALIKEPMNVDMLAEKLGVKKSTVRRYLRELMRLGLVEKAGEEYRVIVAEKAEKEEKKFEDRLLPEDKAFFFYKGIGMPYIIGIRSIKQLLAALENDMVDIAAVSYTIKNGYLQEWLRTVVGAEELSHKIDEVKELPPEELKVKVIEVIRSFLRS